MGMGHWFMPVPVRMRFDDGPVMLVLVMLIMEMAMLMFERIVLVFVLMPFCDMHP